MENIESLLKLSLGEIENILNTKTVVGEPTTIGDTTLIPLLSVGFGFGAGGGSGKVDAATDKAEAGEGAGLGIGGGGGVKPVAMIIVDPSGVRVESVKGTAASAMDSIAAAIAKAVESTTNKKKEAEPA